MECNGWQLKRIEDVAEVVGGGTPSTKNTENYGGSIPWITPKDLSSHRGRYIRRGERNITRQGLETSSARMLPQGAVLVSSRAPVGYVVVAKDSVSTNQGFRSLLLRDANLPEFFYYLLSANTALLESHASGTTFKEISGSSLKQIKLLVPPPDEQRAIASVLGSLDDKIELNRRMNETLERVMRTLFESWFVNFGPVRAKKEGREPSGMGTETADLFPSSFEDSRLGEIPKGWSTGNLGDIAENIRRGVAPTEVPPSTPYIGLEHIPRKSIALDRWGSAEQVGSNKSAFREGEVLFGKLRPYFHKVGVAVLDGVCSTDILVVSPRRPLWYGMALCHLSSVGLVNHADAVSTGTKMPRANWKDLARYPIVIPPEDVAEDFTDRVRPMVEKIRNNILKSRTLAAIRDTLLPKLLSGEVRVEEARELVEEGA